MLMVYSSQKSPIFFLAWAASCTAGLILYKILIFQFQNARAFMGELWPMLVSAMKNPHGIPDSLIEAKRAEMEANKELRFISWTDYN